MIELQVFDLAMSVIVVGGGVITLAAWAMAIG
jgi:hypothetical protein